MRPKRASSWNIKRTGRSATNSGVSRVASVSGSFFSTPPGRPDRSWDAECLGPLSATRVAPTNDTAPRVRLSGPVSRPAPRATGRLPTHQRRGLVRPKAPGTPFLLPPPSAPVDDHPNAGRNEPVEALHGSAAGVAERWPGPLRAKP